jgi:hypothetical protein
VASKQRPVKWNFAELGMDQRIPPVSPSVLGFQDVLNGYFTANASWRTRPGAGYLGDAVASDTSVDGVFDFWVNNVTQYTIKVSKGLFFKLVGSTWTSVSLGTVAVTAGLPVNFAVLNGKVMFGNGTDHNGLFDGTTITDMNAQLAPCKYFLTHGSRIFAAGNPTYPSRLFWCAANNVTDWTTAGDAGAKDAEIGDDIIIGLGRAAGDVWVMKGDKNPGIMQFAGTSYDDFRFLPTFSHTEIAGYHRTIINTGNDLLFQGAAGIYSLQKLRASSGEVEQSRISDPMQKLFSEIAFAKLGAGCAVWYPTFNIAVFYVSFGGTALDGALCVAVPADLSAKYRWSYWKFAPTMAVACRYASATEKSVLLGGTTGRVAKWNAALDQDQDGSVFQAGIGIPYISMGDQRKVKGARHLTMTYLAASGLSCVATMLNGSVYTKPIPSSAGGTWGTGLWGSGFGASAAYPYSSGNANTTNLPLRGLSTAISVRISKVTGVAELYDAQLDVVPAGRSEK